MATQMSKSQLIEKIATTTEVSKKEVKGVMEALVDVGHKELKKNGVFLVPGFAKLPVSRYVSFSRYEFSVLCGACWMPRSS